MAQACKVSLRPELGVLWVENKGLPGIQAHLLNEVLSISTDVIHPILVDSEVCLKSFVFLQQALERSSEVRH